MLVRLRFVKLGKVRFTSHRDVARIWERALRRAELGVAYTEGFSPRPKLHFGLALSTGYESFAEYLEVHFNDPTWSELPGDLIARLNATLPSGITVTAVAPVAAGEPSLQESITSCSWLFALPDIGNSTMSDALSAAMAADSLPLERQRKGKTSTDDLRSSVIELTSAPEQTGELLPVGATGSAFLAELATQPRTARPSELLQVLGFDPLAARVRRLHQWIAHDSDRREPLSAPALCSARIEVCAP